MYIAIISFKILLNQILRRPKVYQQLKSDHQDKKKKAKARRSSGKLLALTQA